MLLYFLLRHDYDRVHDYAHNNNHVHDYDKTHHDAYVHDYVHDYNENYSSTCSRPFS